MLTYREDLLIAKSANLVLKGKKITRRFIHPLPVEWSHPRGLWNPGISLGSLLFDNSWFWGASIYIQPTNLFPSLWSRIISLFPRCFILSSRSTFNRDDPASLSVLVHCGQALLFLLDPWENSHFFPFPLDSDSLLFSNSQILEESTGVTLYQALV